jgi:hypothetical protein
MLFQLLKSVKKWVYKFLFENKLADIEAESYLRTGKNDSNKK